MLATGPPLAHLVMGVSSGKFSVTRLTVTTVLTTTEIITAPSAMNVCTKYGAHKIMIKYHLSRPCGSKKVFYRNYLKSLQQPCKLFTISIVRIRKRRLREDKYFR